MASYGRQRKEEEKNHRLGDLQGCTQKLSAFSFVGSIIDGMGREHYPRTELSTHGFRENYRHRLDRLTRMHILTLNDFA